jgi:alpha-tubulin suppressor-like RCC1 family protein
MDIALAPEDVVGLTSGVALIAAGGSSTCAITADETTWCWGEWAFEDDDVPASVLGLGSAVEVSVGGLHGCAIEIERGVVCWGSNHNGQLGQADGDVYIVNSSYSLPVLGLETGAQALSAGPDRTCALTVDGRVICWGSGHGRTEELQGLTSVAIGISLGGFSTCALTQSHGVACWNVSENSWSLVVGLEAGVAAVAVGDGHACALLETGGVKCWGANHNGQLGDGGYTASSSPVDVSL